MTRIAVIAAGAMGAAVGARLVARGAEAMTSLEGRSPATIRRAQAAGLRDAGADELARADMILSIVPPNQALPLAEWFGDRIARAGTTPLYVDLNAVNPATSHAVGRALAGSGARYVDGSIIGGPPPAEGRGPTLYLSGDQAPAAAAILGDHGLAVKLLEGGIGAASALKMSYGGLTKGLTALAAAMILVAQRAGVAVALAAELASSQQQMLSRLSRSVPDMLPKAYRWVPEMQEIAGFLGADDPARDIYRSIARLYEEVALDQDGGGTLGRALQSFFKPGV
jgi:3-hydroxyisobutyrate dehydrogenase-like beta-hydroxyacid dehydrogenase